MCLIDAIGLKDCGAVIPSTGKYVNDLTGISTELVQKVSDKEQGGFYELWQNVQRVAVGRFNSDFLSAVGSIANFKGSIFRSGNLRVLKGAGLLPVGNQSYKGATITLPSNRGIAIRPKSLQFISKTALIGVDIVALDLIDNSEYWRTTADVAIGKNSIDLSSGTYDITPLYENSQIFIGIDAESIELVQDYSSNEYYYDDCEDCNGNSIGDFFSFRATWVSKSTFAETQKGAGSGVALAVDVACDISVSICDNLNLLSESFMYLLGYILLEEKQNSKNANIFTYFNKEATEALKMSFAHHYDRLLRQAVDQIDFKNYCFNCNDYGSINDGWIMP